MISVFNARIALFLFGLEHVLQKRDIVAGHAARDIIHRRLVRGHELVRGAERRYAFFLVYDRVVVARDDAYEPYGAAVDHVFDRRQRARAREFGTVAVDGEPHRAESQRLELKASLRDEENALLNAKRRTGEYLEKLAGAMEDYKESLKHIYDFVEPLEDLPPVQTEPEPEEPREEEPAPQPEEAPAEPELSISVDDVADMIQRSFEVSEPEEKPEETAEEANRPHIDYDNLKVGADYDRDKKKK